MSEITPPTPSNFPDNLIAEGEAAAQDVASWENPDPHPPVDPKVDPEAEAELHVFETGARMVDHEPEEEPPAAPRIDPDPEDLPVTEPDSEPIPVTEPTPGPEPGPDEDSEPVKDPSPEPLPHEEKSVFQAEPSIEPVIETSPATVIDAALEAKPEALVEAKAAPATLPAQAAKPILPPVKASVPEPIPEEPVESFADIFSDFQRTHSRREGSQIRGTVVALTADTVLVDIGYKSEGILPTTAFPVDKTTGTHSIKAGDTLQVSVKGRDEDGYYQLSLFRTAIPKDWTSLEKAFEEKSTIVGTVTAVVKGGLHVDVGVKAFLPASRSGARDAAEMEKLIGEEIRVRITKLDVADEDVVVDRRVVTEEEALEEKGRRFAQVEEGAVVDGTVRSLMDYGAFIDLGGVDGLLHISDMSWSRVNKPSDILTVGQQLEVKVLKIDPESKRIALGLKQLQPHPWDAVPDKFVLGQRVKGVVTRIADFGAFIELEPGIEGLVHLSEMSYTRRILKATELVQLGDVVDAVILSISPAERRISLGLKQTLGDPWVEAATRLAPGSIIEGPVASITKFGAFVTAIEGVEGLVHISEIVADRRLNHPSDVLRVGQVVRAMVLELDKDKRQMRLSMKQLIPTNLDEFLAEQKVGDIVTGRLAKVENGMAQVELGEGLLIPCKLPAPPKAEPEAAPSAAATGKVDLSAFSSMLKTKWKTGSDPSAAKSSLSTKGSKGSETPQAGQVRRFRITLLDPAAKQIAIELIP
jgi:small subunit ribosomal protein S1